MTLPTVPTQKIVPLIEARRTFTRQRLSDAARRTFFDRGFARSTMEEIARAAGARRSTLYLHFRDKDELLTAIAEEYAVKLAEVMKGIEGPNPSRDEIDVWIMNVAAFVSKEMTPTVLLIDLGGVMDVPPAVRELGTTLLRTLAVQLPAFRKALEPGPEQGLAVARAAIVLRELCLAALHHARHPGEPSRDILTAAGELFENFVRNG
jgi:AcrR family transcriptional regulator